MSWRCFVVHPWIRDSAGWSAELWSGSSSHSLHRLNTLPVTNEWQVDSLFKRNTSVDHLDTKQADSFYLQKAKYTLKRQRNDEKQEGRGQQLIRTFQLITSSRNKTGTCKLFLFFFFKKKRLRCSSASIIRRHVHLGLILSSRRRRVTFTLSSPADWWLTEGQSGWKGQFTRRCEVISCPSKQASKQTNKQTKP